MVQSFPPLLSVVRVQVPAPFHIKMEGAVKCTCATQSNGTDTLHNVDDIILSYIGVLYSKPLTKQSLWKRNI